MPVIMLTARSEIPIKIIGFECGADDYITKPFNILELKAPHPGHAPCRAGASGQKDKASRVQQGHIVLDTDERSAWRDRGVGGTHRQGVRPHGAADAQPRPGLQPENLLNIVWGYEYAGEYRTVDVHIRRLQREKRSWTRQSGVYPDQMGRGVLSEKHLKKAGPRRRRGGGERWRKREGPGRRKNPIPAVHTIEICPKLYRHHRSGAGAAEYYRCWSLRIWCSIPRRACSSLRPRSSQTHWRCRLPWTADTVREYIDGSLMGSLDNAGRIRILVTDPSRTGCSMTAMNTGPRRIAMPCSAR